MNPFAALERRKGYSKRSQASWKKQRALEAELYRCTAWLKVADGNVARLKEDIARCNESMVKGAYVHPTRIGDMTREMEDEQRRATSLKEHADKLRAEIGALARPGRALASERLSQQVALGRLAAERLALDRLIGRAVDQLRALLEERGELTAKMRERASAIDMQGGRDLLDAARFNALLEALPSETAAMSERWAAWFSGAERAKKTTHTTLKECYLGETLASCHHYDAGASIKVTEEQAAQLVADGALPAPPKPQAASDGARDVRQTPWPTPSDPVFY